MLNRLFAVHKTFLKPQPFINFVKNQRRNFKTQTECFRGGCIVKLENSDPKKETIDNMLDLARSIPSAFHNRNGIAFIIDPIAISLPNEKGLRRVLTEFTHIAACILKVHPDIIEKDDETIVSKIQKEFPGDRTKVAQTPYGSIEHQEYKIPGAFHHSSTFHNLMFKIPSGAYGERYFVFICIDSFSKNPQDYIKKIRSRAQKIKKESREYDRQRDSCGHAVLEVFTDLDPNKYASTIPQAVLFDIMFSLLEENNPLAYEEFLNVSIELGLKGSPFEYANNKLKQQVENQAKYDNSNLNLKKVS